MIPNMHVWRDLRCRGDRVSWRAAIERKDGPERTRFFSSKPAACAKNKRSDQGDQKGRLCFEGLRWSSDAIVIATGSEVELGLKAADELAGKGKRSAWYPCHLLTYSMLRMRLTGNLFCFGDNQTGRD